MAKILIVDDSPDIVHLFQEMTELLGHQSFGVTSGAEGLARMQSISPDLILLDLMMPEMDGWAFLRQVRLISDVPVLIITADDTLQNRDRAVDMGALNLLRKEVTPPILRQQIEAALLSAN